MRGFTLLELMVVIAIIAASVTIVLPRIGNRNNQLRATLRNLTVVSRELHSKAKLFQVTYRLVIDMKEDPSGKTVQQYWVEKGNGPTPIKISADRIEKDKDGKEVRVSDFKIDTSTTKEPKSLPTGLSFEFVELSRAPEPIKTGRAYIHYLPQGLVEEAAIHLKTDRGQKYTISIHPLTGRAELISNETSLKEIRDQ